MDRGDIENMGRLGLLGGIGLSSGVVAGMLGGLFGDRRKREQEHADRQRHWRKQHAVNVPVTPKQKRRAKAQAGRKAAHLNKGRGR